MGRIYTVSYQGTVTNAGGDSDLLEVTPADDKPVKLRGLIISQYSEIGDSQEEGLRISVLRLPATFTSGSGGSAPTPAPMDSADVAAGFAAECNNTTIATTSGTIVTLEELGWNERITPFEHWFPDGPYCPKVKQTEGLIIRMQSTPADDFSGAFTFFLEEE